jgi:preprotein translocase subunit SecD
MMPRGLLYRVLLVAGLTLWAVIYLLPSLTTTLPAWWPSFLPSRKINLGLDLRGGTHLLLSLDLEKAVEKALEQNAEELRRALREANVTGMEVQQTGQVVRLRAATQEARNAAEKILSEQFPACTTTLLISRWKRFETVLTSSVWPSRPSSAKGVRTF